MIIAITSTGNTLNSKVSEKFGRCSYFIIIDPDTMKFEAVLNPAEKAQGGAGPKAAEVIINKGVNVLLTGHVGDKAEEALKRGNIKIDDHSTENLSVKEALNIYLSKQKQEK
ncbi:MAG TPA: NifB/NifX family molybdenum-iron cluster-binding protein [Ignavibacteriaceae bacterium]|nr:NifB/NifX family molybdenum-iron cluster-binding protein [Ignavibacteriaceae bacterium]